MPQEAPDLFSCLRTDAEGSAGSGADACWVPAGAGWRRYRACYALIKPEKKDVGAMWRDGGALMELTDAECVMFLRALAAESPERAETERMILRGRERHEGDG